MIKIYTIYKATNIKNNKCYIGIDLNWSHRISAHKAAVKRGSNLLFHNAIRKHGLENFKWEILYQSKDLFHAKNEMEKFFILRENSFFENGFGYNMTLGGEATLGWKPSLETRKKISESKKGTAAWNKGKKMSETFIENNRKAQTGLVREKQRKTYMITNPEGKKFVIKGLKKFCKENNLHVGNMCSVSQGKLNHYKKWKCIRLDT